VVVFLADERTNDRAARALLNSLGEAGIDVLYLGRQRCASRIAASAAATRADSVEVCMADGFGVVVLRELLRELTRLNRREVSLVVHRAR
jgi:methylmalonyl-CoA mutase cobalamin-binding subunit